MSQVSVTMAQVMVEVQRSNATFPPGTRAGDWTAHCGCRFHGDSRTLNKCPGHASGQETVVAERK